MPHKPGIGAILGVVSEDGVAKEDFPVTLLDRTTGELVAWQTTDENGGFTFNGLNPETSDYMVIAQDEDETDSDTYKDAIVKDRIQPIYASQGSTYYRNWLKLATDYGAIGIFGARGVSDSDDTQVLNISGGNYIPTIMTDGGSTIEAPTLGESITPGAPDIACLKLVNQKLSSPSFGTPANSICSQYSSQPLWTSTSAASLEVVVNLSSIDTPSLSTGLAQFSTLAGSINAGYLNNSNEASLLHFVYSTVDKTIQLYCNNNNGYYTTSNGTTIGSAIDVSDYVDDAAHHIVVTVKWSSTACLYIDGTLVTTITFSSGSSYGIGYNSSSYAYGRLIACAYSGYNINTTVGLTADIGVMAAYPFALTASDVSALYEAVMVGTTPELTGYAKDVVLDCPLTYVRLNEASGSTAVDEYLRPLDVYAYNISNIYGSITFGEESPVTGGSIAKFDGSSGVRFNYSAAYLPNPDGSTVEWVGAAGASVPSAYEILVRVSNTSESNLFVEVGHQTTGYITEYLYLQGGTIETIAFSGYTVDTDTHHFAITVDKVNFVATLYVDGVAVDTQTVSSIVALYTAYSVGTYKELHIGAVVSDAGAITSGCNWTLGELAIYSGILSATRIASHVTEMETV